MTNRKRTASIYIGICIAIALTATTNAQRRRGGGGGAGFAFRFLGPQVGNRVAAVAGVPGDIQVIQWPNALSDPPPAPLGA